MKALALLLLSSCAFAQTVSIQVPQQSKYGYPWSVLAGSDRSVYVTPFAETDSVTAWSGDGNFVTFTAANHIEAGDVFNARNFTSAGQNFSQRVWQVVSATPTSFVIQDGTTGSGTETTGYIQKIEGPHFTGDGTWEIITTAGSETFRLYTQDGSQDTGLVAHPVLQHVPSHINFTVGPTAGASSTSGRIQDGNFAIHSTIEFDVKFTLDADPTKTAVFHYIVAANGGGYPYQGVAHVSPGYRQVFKDRFIPLAGQVFGNTNQMMDWTITDKPAGGDGSLQYADYPQPVFFSGTVAGQYEITGCPHVDHSAGACDKLAIWVSPNNPPAANTDKVEQVPCDADKVANFATVMDIGPSQQYKDLLAVPASYTAPLLIRLHNEGPAGQPTEYHNQTQINLPTAGTWDHRHPAVLACGVPNPDTGELPIVDGTNATSNPWASIWVLGTNSNFAFNGIHAGPQFNDGNVKPFHHVTVSGIHLRNVGTSGFRPYGVQYWSAIGNYAQNSALPFLDDCNAQSGWDACSSDTFYEGNHGIGYGIKNQSTEHMFYLQAFRDAVMLNLEEGVTPGAVGTGAYSDRGTRSFQMYNRYSPAPGYEGASGPGGHSEIQDAYNYILSDEYWGYQGAPNCQTAYSTAPGCSGAFGGEDWFAAITEEHNNSQFMVGNAYRSTAGGSKFLSIAGTHNTTGIDNSAQGFYGFNTFYVTPDALHWGQWFIEDVRLGARSDPSEQYLPSVWPRMHVQNNIIPWQDNTNCAYTCVTIGEYGNTLFDFQTNMIAPGQVTVQPNILPTGWLNGGVFHSGINTSYMYYDGWSLTPINRDLGGFTAANFIPFSRFPIDTTTLQAYSDSDAVGKATPPTGQLAYYPPRFNAVDANMSPFTLRKDLTTLGAYDPSSVPTPATVATAPPPVTTPPATPPPADTGTTTPTPAATAAAPDTQWVKLGAEGTVVHGRAGMTFRYGTAATTQANNGYCNPATAVPENWLTKTLTADQDVTASNDFFGSDPAYCAYKELDLQYNAVPQVVTNTVTQTVQVPVNVPVVPPAITWTLSMKRNSTLTCTASVNATTVKIQESCK